MVDKPILVSGNALMAVDNGDGTHTLKVAGGAGGGGGGSSDTLESTQLLVKTAVQNLDTDLGNLTATAAPSDGVGDYSVVSALKRMLLNGAAILARLPAAISGRVPTMDAAYDPIFQKLVIGNARGKVRDGFDTLDLTNVWELVQTGSGDVILTDGNANGTSYQRLVKSPIMANTETILLSRKTFKLPSRVAIGASLSQRIAGQEFYFELVGVDGSGAVVTDAADAPVAVTGIATAATVWTVTTATPHGYVVGDTVQPYGFADSRFNTVQSANSIVTGVLSPTSFTINAANLSNASSGAGSVLRVRASGNAVEAVGYRWSGTTANNANPYTRSGSPSVYTGNESGFGTSNSTVQAGYNVANTYAHQPTTSFELISQMESVHWLSLAMDTLSTPTIVKRMQSLPDIERDYKIRVRARNLPNLTVPVGKITNAVKSGTTTATLTIPNHGLNISDQVVVYGIRDQAATSFPNLTTATAIASIVDANTITIVQGTAGTATSAGGYVARVQGGVTAFGAIGQVVQSISRTANQITVVGSAAWSGLAIGETVVLYGMDGAGAAYDGTYRVANVSTTNLVLDATGADFGSITCGGGVIKTTDMRLHFIRALDYTRTLTEVVGGLNRRDGNNAVPVVVQPNSDALSTTIASGTVTTVGTVSAVTGGGIAEGTATSASPVTVGGLVRTAAVTLAASVAARLGFTSAGGALVATAAPAFAIEVASAARTASGNSGTISVPTGGSICGNIVVSANAGTTPTLDITLEESLDNGTTWQQVWAAPRITGNGSVPIPMMQAPCMRRWVWTVGGATPSFTFAININQASTVVPIIRKLFDRTANVLNGTAAAATAALPVAGCDKITAKVAVGAVTTTPGTYQLQVSDDNVNWSNVGTATPAVANSTVTFSAPAGTLADWARVIVTSAASGQTGTYVAIQAAS